MSGKGRVSAAAGLALAVWFAVILADHGWNPSTLIAVGRDDLRVSAYVEDRLGPDFEFQVDWGHDGKHVFVQAHDPWLLNPGEHAAVLDAPVYRSQRVLVPVLVGTGSVFGEWGVVWAFPVLMVLAVMVGTWAMAGLVELAGGSVWWSLAFLANPGLFYSYRRGTVDVLAVSLLMLGVYLASTGRLRRAGMVLAGAALAKEVMLVGAIGMALHLWRSGRRFSALVTAPVLAVIAWGVYVRIRLREMTAFGAEAITLPFRGLWRVIAGHPEVSAVIALVVLGVATAAVLQAARRPSLAGSAAAGFAFLLPLLPEAVWNGYVDAWRAAAPLLALATVAALQAIGPLKWRRSKRQTEPAIA